MGLASCSTSSNEPIEPPMEECHPGEDYLTKFHPGNYLKDFYSQPQTEDEPAMKFVLFFTPSLLQTAKFLSGRDDLSLLDVGCGPTIYVPMAARNVAKDIWMADYAGQNRSALKEWLEGKSNFDWTAVAKFIASIEGDLDGWKHLEPIAKERVRAILSCDVHQPPVITSADWTNRQWDIVTTFFCPEYACRNRLEYLGAMRNICGLIAPKGFLVMGCCYDESSYYFSGVKFSCHKLSPKDVSDALSSNHMTEVKKYCKEGVLVILARKNV